MYNAYIVKPAVPRTRSITEEMLWYDDNVKSGVITLNKTNTVTHYGTVKSLNYFESVRVRESIRMVSRFVERYAGLYEVDRHTLYKHFCIPKSSGGVRPIDAPQSELMEALRDLKGILERNCGADMLYHTSAFAYIQNRSTLDCVKRHQQNESKWFAKFDMHNFFGSTTIDFVMRMFEQIYPLSELAKNAFSSEVFRKAIDLCFLDGGLPQGTPISPLITNIMMIPFDFAMNRWCREHHMVYTRYADDLLISSKSPFRFKDVEEQIESVLVKFDAPFHLNRKKTRYGSANGSNWNLGVMLNKDNKITVGRKAKKRFEDLLRRYALDKKAGTDWALVDVQHLDGLRSYYKMVEGETIDRIIQFMSNKFQVDIQSAIKKDLRELV